MLASRPEPDRQSWSSERIARPLGRARHDRPSEQIGPKLGHAGPVAFLAGPEEHVSHRDGMLQLLAPQLLESPPQTIAGHCGLAEPRDDESQTRRWPVASGPQDVEVLPAGSPACPQDAPDFIPTGQPVRARMALAVGQTRACLEPTDTVSRLRPFLRRRDSTARPQRSAIRFRKPCLAMRRLFRGRYVGCIPDHSIQESRTS